jgi:ribonuclease HI
MIVDAYTDGACSGNPGPGGWGALLLAGDHEKELTGGTPETTNNRMELTAAIEALNAVKAADTVRLHTDSTYVRNGITQWLARDTPSSGTGSRATVGIPRTNGLMPSPAPGWSPTNKKGGNQSRPFPL